MSAAFEAVIDVANRTGRPVPEVLRHHYLEAALRRLARSPEAGAFALRGSMITRLWAAPFPRIAADLDFLGTFAHSVEGTASRFFSALERDAGDCVTFRLAECFAKPIWEGSEFPGVRLTLRADVLGEDQGTTVDVGFGDPLVPAAEFVEYATIAGDTVRCLAVHPATLIGWKLHGLTEWGRARWRPKDLLDLWLLTRRFVEEPNPPARQEPNPPTPFPSGNGVVTGLQNRTTDTAAQDATETVTPLPFREGGPGGLGSSGAVGFSLLSDAINVAYTSRGYTPSAAPATLLDAYWESFSAKGRWAQFRAENPEAPIPESVLDVRNEVLDRLRPALALLPSVTEPDVR